MKKLMTNKLKSSKKGVTSLYIVVFATILFGVITLSFLRIVISEASQSSEDDLSRSAYDAAMAGVEDAKTAINQYYNCLGGAAGRCDTTARAALFKKDCNDGIGLANYLYDTSYDGGEVLIQENNPGGNTADNNSDQAYTCVVISDTVPDYRGTLSADTRTKVVPLRVFDGIHSATEGEIKSVDIEWYSSLNEGSGTPVFKDAPDDVDGHPAFRDNVNKTIPPTIQLTYIKIKDDFDIEKFHQANSDGSYEYSTMLILPNSHNPSGAVTTISDTERKAAGNISEGDKNTSFGVTCSTSGEFACKVTLTETNIGASDSAFLVISLPYTETVSDFAVTLRDSSNKPIYFEGVQISVDATGRTNQLVRRVESRLDPADLFFPYPQYALELSGGDNPYALYKNFWITANCWYSQPTVNSGTAPAICDNNNYNSTYSP